MELCGSDIPGYLVIHAVGLVKVWLPLLSRSEDKAHNFMSRRIMLPFRVDIYPLGELL